MLPQNPYPVVWVKNSKNGEYFDLLRLNLDGAYFLNRQGVYIIWYASPHSAKVITVGQGNLGERLKSFRAGPYITQFSTYGQIKVSWVEIPSQLFDRVQAFLYDYYKPVVGERVANTLPLPVTPLL